jgi:hypothetical protein
MVTTRRTAQRKMRWSRLDPTKLHVGVEEVVDLVPRTDLLVLVPATTSRRRSGSAQQQQQQRLHGVHTYRDRTPCADMLAPRARLGFRVSAEGDGRLGFGRGGTNHSVPSPSNIYIECTNGLPPCRPISNPNPLWINIL